MRSVKYTQLRLPEKYADLALVFNDLFTQVLNKFDIRDDGSVYASKLYFDDNEVLQVDDARINEGTKITSQRVIPTLNVASVASVQNTIPLTASADAVTAEIQVASHTVLYGGQSSVYNSGSVVGLLPQTDYYVYTDDPDYEGGAVAYFATTNYQLLADELGRYYVGAIRTPLSTISAAITAATQANPCVITTGASHGFDTGDQVTFSGVGGMTQLNTLPATAITVLSPTTFSLNGIDSTAFGVYTSGGTVTRVATDGLYAGGAGGGSGYIYDFVSYGQPL